MDWVQESVIVITGLMSWFDRLSSSKNFGQIQLWLYFVVDIFLLFYENQSILKLADIISIIIHNNISRSHPNHFVGLESLFEQKGIFGKSIYASHHLHWLAYAFHARTITRELTRSKIQNMIWMWPIYSILMLLRNSRYAWTWWCQNPSRYSTINHPY